MTVLLDPEARLWLRPAAMKLVDLPSKPITCHNLVGNEWIESSAETRQVLSPYSGQAIGTVPMGGATEVDQVVRAATAAASDWRQVPLKERTQLLFKYRDLLHANIERLSHCAAGEAGKTVAEARAGVLKGIEVLEYALSVQNLDEGAALEVSRGVTCEIRREPMGVVAGITPFNFPAMVPLWLFPIATALGNTFILKPSEKVPLSSLILGELWQDAGFPPGVLNIVHGGQAAVEAICDHPGISALGFVGSTKVAKIVYGRASLQGKRALCLGGAKNHLIVVPDADPAVTIDGVVSSFVGCAGQRCMAASLMVAVGDIDDLVDAIVERASNVRLGTDMGALIDEAATQRLTEAVAIAEKEGATIRLDGRNPEQPEGYAGGNWMAPTIIDNVKVDHDSATRELFGPILSIVRVSSLEEAMSMEQDSNYGNAASVFTTNGAVARYVAANATAGMVGVNIGVPVPREPFSFGGTKESRFGHGDITGRAALDLWSQTKKITTKWQLQSDANWMS